MDNQVIVIAFASVADILWDFLDLQDVLNVSVCSRAFAQIPVPKPNLNRLISRNPNYSFLAQMKLNFAHDLTTGLVRRAMNRIRNTLHATIFIDDRNGRFIMDIGSAFNNNDAFLARDVHPVTTEGATDGEMTPDSQAQIVKEIEISSYDEYDDFNPRHPMMKDRAHRRGDSLFNSDIDFVNNELNARSGSSSGSGSSRSGGGGSHGFDLSTIAAKAAQEEAANRETHTEKASVKNRMLAKKTQGSASKVGLPPTGKQ